MSSPQFETFLAKLFTDRKFLDRFLIYPDAVLFKSKLTMKEMAALKNIDVAGLIMAHESYEKKRIRIDQKRNESKKKRRKHLFSTKLT